MRKWNVLFATWNVLFAAENEQGQAPNTEQTTTTQAPGAPTGGKENQATTGAAGQVNELPDWAQALIKELRGENAKHRKSSQEAAEAAKLAEEKRLAEQQQWQQLAEKRKGELDALSPKAQQADELAKLLTQQINSEIRDWPDEVKSLAPQGEVSAAEMLRWVESARALATKLSQKAAPATGNGRLPKPAGVGEADKDRLGREALVRIKSAF